MTERKSKPDVRDAQEPLDQGDLHPPADRNPAGRATGPLPSTWVSVAEAACPGFMQVFSQATKDLIRSGVFPQDQAGQNDILRSLQWLLSPGVFRIALASRQRDTEQRREREPTTEDPRHQSDPHRRATVVYVVFHHGRPHIYYDTLPPEILDLRGQVAFWIDHSTNEVWVRDKPLEENERLQPRTEEMLRYLCQIELAGQTILLSKLYMDVWRPPALPKPGVVRNNIGVQQNAINTFAGEKFILTPSAATQSDQRKIFRRRGEDAYTIGNNAYEELCIIRRFPSW